VSDFILELRKLPTQCSYVLHRALAINDHNFSIQRERIRHLREMHYLSGNRSRILYKMPIDFILRVFDCLSVWCVCQMAVLPVVIGPSWYRLYSRLYLRSNLFSSNTPTQLSL